MFDEATRDAAAANTSGFGDAFAGRGESINTAIGAFRPLLRDVVPVAQNLVVAADQPAPLLRRAGRRGGDRGAGRRGAGRAVRQPRHDVRRAARGRAPLHPGVDHRGVPALETAIRTLPVQRPFLRNTRGPVPRAAAGRRRAADLGADDRRRARGGRARAAAHAAVQPPARVAARRAPDLRRGPAGPARARRHHRHAPVAGADAGVHHARPDRLQLPDAVLPQRRVAAQRRRPQRHLAALHHRRHAAGPEQRRRPVLGAGQRADRGQPPAHQPVPEHGGARPAARVRGGQRAVPARPDRAQRTRPAPSRRARRASPDGRRSRAARS